MSIRKRHGGARHLVSAATYVKRSDTTLQIKSAEEELF